MVPTDYHGIPFDEWLDIFLQYALLVTDQGEQEEAYETLEAADHANIWHYVKSKKQVIHVCWFSEYPVTSLGQTWLIYSQLVRFEPTMKKLS